MEKIQRSLKYIQEDDQKVIVQNEAATEEQVENRQEEEQQENVVKGYDVYQQLKKQTVQSKAQSVIDQNQAKIDEIAKLLASV